MPQGRQNGVGNVPKDVANIQQRSIREINASDNAVLRALPVPQGRQNGAGNVQSTVPRLPRTNADGIISIEDFDNGQRSKRTENPNQAILDALTKTVKQDTESYSVDEVQKRTRINETERIQIQNKIDSFSVGDIDFVDVVEDYAKLYAEIVNSNEAWEWKEDIHGGKKLTKAQKAKIKQVAVANGSIPDVKINYVDGRPIADFRGEGLILNTEHLKEEMWLSSDDKQFDWLDEQIGGRPDGYTWHHSEIPGQMELVPFGIHNVTNHHGGRAKGLWAYGKR